MKLQKDTNDSSTLILWAHFHVSCKTVFNLTGSYYYIALVILRTSKGQYINRRNYKSEKWSNENFYRLQGPFKKDFKLIPQNNTYMQLHAAVHVSCLPGPVRGST